MTTTTMMLPEVGETILVRTVPYEVDMLFIAVRAVMDTREPVFCPGKSFEIEGEKYVVRYYITKGSKHKLVVRAPAGETIHGFEALQKHFVDVVSFEEFMIIGEEDGIWHCANVREKAWEKEVIIAEMEEWQPIGTENGTEEDNNEADGAPVEDAAVVAPVEEAAVVAPVEEAAAAGAHPVLQDLLRRLIGAAEPTRMTKAEFDAAVSDLNGIYRAQCARVDSSIAREKCALADASVKHTERVEKQKKRKRDEVAAFDKAKDDHVQRLGAIDKDLLAEEGAFTKTKGDLDKRIHALEKEKTEIEME
jgi:hypothetical protein